VTSTGCERPEKSFGNLKLMRELLTLLFCSLVSAIDVFFFQELVVNPDILPREPNQRTFADIRIGNGLVDWEPYDLDILRVPLVDEVPLPMTFHYIY
jgi:hypothetical protein